MLGLVFFGDGLGLGAIIGIVLIIIGVILVEAGSPEESATAETEASE